MFEGNFHTARLHTDEIDRVAADWARRNAGRGPRRPAGGWAQAAAVLSAVVLAAGLAGALLA